MGLRPQGRPESFPAQGGSGELVVTAGDGDPGLLVPTHCEIGDRFLPPSSFTVSGCER